MGTCICDGKHCSIDTSGTLTAIGLQYLDENLNIWSRQQLKQDCLVQGWLDCRSELLDSPIPSRSASSFPWQCSACQVKRKPILQPNCLLTSYQPKNVSAIQTQACMPLLYAKITTSIDGGAPKLIQHLQKSRRAPFGNQTLQQQIGPWIWCECHLKGSPTWHTKGCDGNFTSNTSLSGHPS